MRKIIKNASKVIFSLLLIVSIFGVVNVLAEEVIFKITKIEVKEKSDKVTVNDVSLSGGTITNDIVFTDKDDYITYNITIKNNTSDKYTIKSISDDNTSQYLKYTYDDLSNIELDAGDEKTFNLTITYVQETTNLTISDQAVSLTLTYEKEDGTTGSQTITNSNNSASITNPKTGDNITLYIILGLVSVTGLVIISVSKKQLSKSLMVVAVASSVLLPLGVKADSDKFIIKFNNNIKEKEYTVEFNTNGGSSRDSVKVVKGGKVTKPTDPEKTGNKFVGWYTTESLSTLFDFNTTITEDTIIYAKYNLKQFNVSFNTGGGTSINPQTITYGEKVSKPTTDPEKTDYVFDGWYTDSSFNTLFDFNKLIDDDTIIYASFHYKCRNFSTDSWSTIVNNISNDSNYYAVGCEKEVGIDMDGNNTPESYTVRIANTSTPDVCSVETYSQTSCGTVIEFFDVLGSRLMNSNGRASGGWKSTDLAAYLNNQFYNKLPEDLRNVIIPTYPIVSGHPYGTTSPDITIDDTTLNKVFLLSPREIGFDSINDMKKDVLTDTRTLDYYLEHSDASSRIKYDLSGNSQYYWLRSGNISLAHNFFYVSKSGGVFGTYSDTSLGFAPAFRIGK